MLTEVWRVSLYDPAAWRLRAVEIQIMLNGCKDSEIRPLLRQLIKQYERLAELIEGRQTTGQST